MSTLLNILHIGTPESDSVSKELLAYKFECYDSEILWEFLLPLQWLI